MVQEGPKMAPRSKFCEEPVLYEAWKTLPYYREHTILSHDSVQCYQLSLSISAVIITQLDLNPTSVIAISRPFLMIFSMRIKRQGFTRPGRYINSVFVGRLK